MSQCQLFSKLVRSVVVMAVACAPSLAAADAPVKAPPAVAGTQKPAVIDVALHPEGLLVGQLVAASGSPAGGSTVTLALPDGRQATAKTNEQGGFAFRGVNGMATLRTERALAMVRIWAPGTAPPSATPALLLVEDSGVARGQHYAGTGTQNFFSKGKMLMANPLFVAGVITTAVAVPVAIANDDDDPAS